MCQAHFLLKILCDAEMQTDRKEEKLCFAESEKMIHAGVKVENHIVSVI